MFAFRKIDEKIKLLRITFSQQFQWNEILIKFGLENIFDEAYLQCVHYLKGRCSKNNCLLICGDELLLSDEVAKVFDVKRLLNSNRRALNCLDNDSSFEGDGGFGNSCQATAKGLRSYSTAKALIQSVINFLEQLDVEHIVMFYEGRNPDVEPCPHFISIWDRDVLNVEAGRLPYERVMDMYADGDWDVLLYSEKLIGDIEDFKQRCGSRCFEDKNLFTISPTQDQSQPFGENGRFLNHEVVPVFIYDLP